jgi:hypothetical protein
MGACSLVRHGIREEIEQAVADYQSGKFATA